MTIHVCVWGGGGGGGGGGRGRGVQRAKCMHALKAVLMVIGRTLTSCDRSPRALFLSSNVAYSASFLVNQCLEFASARVCCPCC